MGPSPRNPSVELNLKTSAEISSSVVHAVIAVVIANQHAKYRWNTWQARVKWLLDSPSWGFLEHVLHNRDMPLPPKAGECTIVMRNLCETLACSHWFTHFLKVSKGEEPQHRVQNKLHTNIEDRRKSNYLSCTGPFFNVPVMWMAATQFPTHT